MILARTRGVLRKCHEKTGIACQLLPVLLMLNTSVANPEDAVGDGVAVDPADVYMEKSITCASDGIAGLEFKYQLLSPPEMAPRQTYPLVVFLHGAGERGTDNQLQFVHFAGQMAQPHWRNRFPCFLLAPQCRADQRWVETDWTRPNPHTAPERPDLQMRAAIEMLERTLAEEPIDRKRIYLTGLSMGGFGAWDLAMRKPDLFAALAAVCGGADDKKMAVLKDMPVWVVHGTDDNVVPVSRSRSAVAALRAVGGAPVYVELPGVRHDAWVPAYTDHNGLVPWLFRQCR